MSVSQFLDALERRMRNVCDEEIEELDFGRFLIGVSRFSVARGQTSGAGMEMTTTRKADQHATRHKSPYLLRGSADIVLVVDCEVEIEDEEGEDTILQKEMTTVIHQMKFLGGHITDLNIEVFDIGEFKEKARKKIAGKRKCYFYRLRDELLQRYLAEYGNPVRAVMEASRPVYHKDAETANNMDEESAGSRKRPTRNEPGFLFLSSIGYQLLEQPKQRRNTRFSWPHAFAEPIFSLIELIPASKAMKVTEKGEMADLYWQKKYDRNSLSYFVLQQ
jgi:hypothetical protein